MGTFKNHIYINEDGYVERNYLTKRDKDNRSNQTNSINQN